MSSHDQPSTSSEFSASVPAAHLESDRNSSDSPWPGWTNFIALWTASGSSYFAYWIMLLALSLLANRLTTSSLLVSGVTFALTVPTFLFGLLAGVLVDRSDRRLFMFGLAFLRLLAFGLAWLAIVCGYFPLFLLYGLAFILGLTQTLEEPALAALVPMVVAPRHLERANGWLVGAQNSIELLALPLGGLLASISTALTMGIGTGCALLTLGALLCLRGTYAPILQERRHLGHELLAGLHFLWQQPLLLAIALMAMVINASWGAYLALLVRYAVAPGPVGLSAANYGFLLMGSSLGGVGSAFLLAPVQRWLGRRWPIGLNILGNGLMFLAPALSTNAWIIGGGAVLGGLTGPLWTIAVAALLGRQVPARLQGRVTAAYRFLSNGMAAIGPLLGGLFAQLYGLRPAFFLCATCTFLMLLPFSWFITEKAMREHPPA
ncbi:MFS transporter [Dictyobacter kobayashii]|uniref:MFS transporter n=1 Tax=Dictyobacter kobayashii TaxID=2014872 RepID=A0A402AYP6_9CHLR|nr:MFS transporter [Dictyobacter kobayashii]GCE24226.1 MFS transporter [Dictyobacter kobayashii]